MNGKIVKMALLLLLVVVLPLGIGSSLASKLVPAPKVGVVRVWFDLYYYTTEIVIQQLNHARDDHSIKAVVLLIDSPGGEVTSSENLFYSLLDLREELPVVASVDYMAASGAYYLAVAADEIYAKPTSLVGNIGVIGYAAPMPYVDEQVLTTGPYKAFGGTQAGQVQQMEIAKESFLTAVAAGRGSRLQASLDFLSRGEIFSGVQAVEKGLIDGLASNDTAVARAAELAGLRNYEVVELWDLTFPEEESPFLFQGKTDWRPVNELPPGLYYRYIELPR